MVADKLAATGKFNAVIALGAVIRGATPHADLINSQVSKSLAQVAIARGVPDSFVVPNTEMYGEPFGIPEDAHPVFMSWYEGGNVFRSGITFRRGAGKIFYFSPGHESFPIYRNPDVVKVLANAVRWAAPDLPPQKTDCWDCDPATEPVTTRTFS